MKNILFIVTNTAEIGPKHRKTGYFFPEVAHPYHEFTAQEVVEVRPLSEVANSRFQE